MLTRVLLKHVAIMAAFLLGGGALVCYFAFGADVALGFLVGGLVAVADGLGVVYLVGGLLSSQKATGTKIALGLLLTTKLLFAGGILWAAINVWGVDSLGLIVGLAAGLTATVAGATRGSTSDEGVRAIDDEVARIREETEDKPDESR